jgi:hypothetical protein
VVWPQNHWDDFFRFGLKTCGVEFFNLGFKIGSYGLMIWASKSLRRFFDLGLKTKWDTVYRLRHKINMTMKTTQGHTLKSSGLFCVETSRTRVFQSDLNTGGDVRSGGARGTIVKVA